MFIYKTTNLIDGKIYIGKKVKDRKGYLGSGLYLRNAINLYGKLNFTRDIVEDGIADKKLLSEREKYWIAFYKATDLNIGYNLSEGGDGLGLSGENHPMFGKKHSSDARRKMSENHANVKGENHPFYGKHHSVETIQKIINTEKNRSISDITKKNMAESRRGMKYLITSTSKYVGVSLDKLRNKWTAQIKKNKQGYFLGRFSSEEEAAIAYNKKATELYGESARLNNVSTEKEYDGL